MRKKARRTMCDDPELAFIAANLRATAAYAISPVFLEELYKQLLQAFVEWKDGRLAMSMSHKAMQQQEVVHEDLVP